MLPIRIRLLGGTLKVKRYVHLRYHELERRVPVWQLGRFYFVWLKKPTGRRGDRLRDPEDI